MKKYRNMLEKGGFQISIDADLVFQEIDYKLEYIIAKDKELKTVLIYLNDIILIETYGKDLLVYTLNNSYLLKNTVLYYQNLLSPYGFKRISQSSIIHKRNIIKISPAISMKFTLKLKNNKKVYVTRSYYYDFKDYIGL